MKPGLVPTGRLPVDGSPEPSLSVAIPVLDGGQRLVELLAALAEQETRGPVELLLADSGSTDGIPTAAQERWPDILLFDVDGPYDHGLVRSALVARARAPLVALLSQDAVPLGHDYLETLAGSFADPDVAGAYARQLPGSGADPLIAARLARWTPPGDEVLLSRLEKAQVFEDLEPPERMLRARFDNVASMVRREVLLELPFPARPFGEDIAWGAAALREGHTLAYVPTAAVEHHHRPTLRGTFQRHRLSHRQAAAEFDLRSVPSLPAAALALATGLPGDLRDGGPAWAARGLPRRAAALLGQWIGGREGSTG